MELLIDQFLAYARVGPSASSYERIDMNDLVRDALTLVEMPDSFTVDVDVDVAPFIGSATPLETILRNLVANAVRHHDRADGRVLIRAHTVGDTCRIEVIDDGPGITAASHGRMLRSLQTMSGRHRANTGYGLTVCRQLCNEHAASFDFDAHPGRGSRFVVDWPFVSSGS
jgi:signal transduction histidine kinase